MPFYQFKKIKFTWKGSLGSLLDRTERGTYEKALFLAQVKKAKMSLPKCSVALGKFNYVELLKHHSHAIKSGIEQRDAAIKIGAKDATALSFKDTKFMMPSNNTNYDSLQK
ncbi:hypothetical protein BH18THE2_BH18THE2_06630 [soil metagenome]